ALAAPDDERDVDEDLLVAVRLRHARDLEDVPAALALGREREARRPARRGLELLHLDLLDLLEAALRLPRLRRLGAEALHPRLLLRDDRLGARDLGLLALADGDLLARE